MKIVYEIEWINQDEWLKHLYNAVKNRGSKTDEELVLEASNFDFKFDSISSQSQSSSIEPQNS